MDIDAIREALTEAAASDEPTTRKAARELSATLTEHLAELREFVNDLDSVLSDTEAAAESLVDADRVDLSDLHAELAGGAAELQDQLAALRSPTAVG